MPQQVMFGVSGGPASEPSEYQQRLERMQALKREQEINEDRMAAQTPQVLSLCGVSPCVGALPNHLNRSSLFAPIAQAVRKQAGGRRYLVREILVSRNDVRIEYTGEQLDESDCDILLGLTILCKDKKLGEWLKISRHRLLKLIGKTSCRPSYEWLYRRIKAMTEVTLFIETLRRSPNSNNYKIGIAEGFHIVSGFRYEDETKDYEILMDPRWVKLFSNNEYTLIDLEIRKQIRVNKGMAKAIHRLVLSSSDKEQHYDIHWLQKKMQHTGRMRDFLESVRTACDELVRLHFLEQYALEYKEGEAQPAALWVTRASRRGVAAAVT